MTSTFMTFPCDFSIKIIGENMPDFASNILSIGQKYYPKLTTADIRTQLSKQDRYIAVHLMVHAEDQKTLDSLYLALTQAPHVRMVL